MRLLSREILRSEWITLLIVAYSTVMVMFVVVACVIGLPRLAISISEPVVRSEERILPHGDFRSAIWQRFLRILYSLGKAVFTGLPLARRPLVLSSVGLPLLRRASRLDYPL